MASKGSLQPESPANFTMPQRPHATNDHPDLVINAPNAMETTHPSSATTLKQHFILLPAIAQTPINIKQLQSELTGYLTLLKH